MTIRSRIALVVKIIWRVLKKHGGCLRFSEQKSQISEIRICDFRNRIREIMMVQYCATQRDSGGFYLSTSKKYDSLLFDRRSIIFRMNYERI